MSERQKTLVLKRASLLDGHTVSLEELFRSVFQRAASARDRIIDVDLLRSLVFARIDQGPNGDGVYIRAFEFEKGAIGSINFESTNTSAELEEVLPPSAQHFLHSEITLFVRGNDVIACGMQNKNRTFVGCLGELTKRMRLVDQDFAFCIEDVPNRVQLDDLVDVGVKDIDLGISDYLASLPDTTYGMQKVLRTLLVQPASNAGIKKRQNARGRLKLSRGRFLKDEIKKDEWLTEVGKEIVKSDLDEAYRITLEDGRSLTNTNLKMIKKVKVRRFANTVSYEHMQSQMHNFWLELHRMGVFEG